MSSPEAVINLDLTNLKRRLAPTPSGFDLGSDAASIAWNSLQSLLDNLNICRYHYSALKELLSERLGVFKGLSEHSAIRSMRKAFRENEPDEVMFRLACKANIGALLRVLHSNSDLLANFVHYCLLVNVQGHTNIHSVIKELKGDDSKSELVSLLEEFRSGGDYAYLVAWCNNSKHWTNIEPVVTHSLIKPLENIISWQFQSFIYNKVKYDSVDALPFLEREFDRQGHLIFQIIREVDSLHEQLCLKQ